MSSARKIRVAVVFGGRSAEHAVSCASAGLVLGAIDRDRYDVVPIGIARDGRWVLTSGDPARLALIGGDLAVGRGGRDARGVRHARGRARRRRARVQRAGRGAAELGEVDVVLPLLHGTYGEDGTIQGLLEMAGIRYAGAGVLASAAGMDKEYMKLLFAARGLPIGRYVVVRDRDWGRAASARRAQARARRDRRARLAGVRQARQGRVVDRHVAGRPRPTSSRRRSRRPAVRQEGARRGGDRRRRGRVRRARGDRRRGARGVGARADRGRPALAPGTTSRPSTWARSRGWRFPRRSPPRRPSGCARWRARRSTRSAARGWPGWTSSTPRPARCSSTRSTPCRG